MARTSEDHWQAYRRKMLRETEQFIEWGLRHPDEVNWIPSWPVGKSRVPSQVARWFYNTLLTSGDEGGLRGLWRRRLGRRR